MKTHLEEIKDFMGFLRDILVSCVIVCGILGIIILTTADSDSYASSLAFKETLLRDTPSPRMIIIGGSGASSSIDSEKMLKATGYNPVNMGLYAGLGMRFVFNQIRDEIRNGDIVLFAPEYELLQQPSYGDGHLLLEMLHENQTKLPEVIYPHSLVVIARALPGWLQLQVREIGLSIIKKFSPREKTFVEILYGMENINMYGDLDTSIVSDVHLTPEDIMKDTYFVRPHIDTTNLALLKDFAVNASAQGVKIFVVLPAVPRTLEKYNIDAVTSQYRELVDTMGTEYIIGTPGYFVFPDEQFLDSLGHLTATGKAVRTDKILKLLVPKLP